MQQHYKILGILYIVYGGLNVLIGFVVGGFLHMMVNMPGHMDRQEEFVLGIISTIIPIVLIVVSLPNIVAGIGLLNHKRWALIMGVVLSVFNIMNMPFGTGLSIYSIYVLVKEEDERNSIKRRQEWA